MNIVTLINDTMKRCRIARLQRITMYIHDNNKERKFFFEFTYHPISNVYKVITAEMSGLWNEKKQIISNGISSWRTKYPTVYECWILKWNQSDCCGETWFIIKFELIVCVCAIASTKKSTSHSNVLIHFGTRLMKMSMVTIT